VNKTRSRRRRGDLRSIATKILEELEDEEKWDIAFAQSQDRLAELASEAMAEYQAGETEALDPDKL
jgi:hypothetical protein